MGIPVLPVHVNYSEDHFSVERIGHPGRQRWAIRIGLRQIAQVGDDLAKAILFARRPLDEETSQLHEQPFTSLWDALTRLRPAGLTRTAAEALVWSGACDGLAPRMERRQRLWQLRELWPLVDPHPKGIRRRRTKGAPQVSRAADQPQQLTLTWEMPVDSLEDVPNLPTLTAIDRDALDYQLLDLSPRKHPMRHYRPMLDRRGILRIVVLEDETGRLPLAMAPALAAELRHILRDARYLIAIGRLERVRWYCSLWAFELVGMNGNTTTRSA